MRDVLAERLLAEVMHWTPEDVTRERPVLQAMATYKYDSYQQFSPGMRFVESLGSWLAQFETPQERQLAYRLVRSELVFVSAAEMAHFVSMAYPDYIRPLLFRICANDAHWPERTLGGLARSTEFRTLLRQSLFLGLSDGAHIDLFRRTSREVSHEQIWQTYDLSEPRAAEMLARLAQDLEHLLGRKPTRDEKEFRVLFLLDDFSGSGLSYFREEAEGTGYSGKVYKILDKLHSDERLKGLVDPADLYVGVVLYVASTRAIKHIEECARAWLAAQGSSARCTVLAVQEIPDSVRLDPKKAPQTISLLKSYFDDGIVDEHYRKGKHEKPYLGFDECALPLVLEHNTPNNSVPLLWFEEHRKYKGAFPRVSRHRGER